MIWVGCMHVPHQVCPFGFVQSAFAYLFRGSKTRGPLAGSPSEAGRGTAATGTYDVSCVASVACTVPASVLSAVHWPVWIMIRDLTFRANLSQRGRDLNQE